MIYDLYLHDREKNIMKGHQLNTCTIGNNGLECFKALSEADIELIEANSLYVDYKRGENICKQGTFASHIMVLHEGLAKVYMEGCSETLIIKILPAVNIIGLPFLSDASNIFYYSAQAYLDSKVQLIEINTFRQILSSNAPFAAKIINMLGENTITAFGRFFCLTKKQTYGRMADILLCLSQRIYKAQCFPLHLTRKELAELASMSVESITRILTKYKEDGLIRMDSESIEIIDLERLTLISQNG